MTLERPSPEAAVYKLLTLITDHSKKLGESFKQLEEMVTIYLAGKANKKIKELADAIKNTEKEGNEIKLQIFDYLARVGEALMYREDWMRLILNLDSILDYVDSIAYRLSIAASKKWYPTTEVADGIRHLLSLINAMIDKIKLSLGSLQVNALRVLQICNELEEMERQVDEHHRELGSLLLESNVSTPALMLIHEICERLEDLADIALRTGDSLRLLAMHRVP